MDIGVTSYELMVITAAREIRDGDLVFVGMRLPLLAYNLAKNLWAPNAVGLFEAGLIREESCSGDFHTMCDLPFQNGASWLTGLIEVMACLQRGEVDIGIIGGAQIDSEGNVNSSWVRSGGRMKRLPGSGGACDIAVFCKHLIVLMPLEPRRVAERVDYITSPAHGRGVTLITDKAVFRKRNNKLQLSSVYPGVSLEEVIQVAKPLLDEVPNDVYVEKPPTDEEITTLRRLDKNGFWTRRANV